MPSFPYQILRSKKFSSSLSLSVHPEKGVIVKAPFWVPDIAIRHFIAERESWIQQQLAKINLIKVPPKKYISGEKHLYRGQEYELKIVLSPSPTRTTITAEQPFLIVTLYRGHPESTIPVQIKDSLLRFYLESGIAHITERVNFFSDLLGVTYSRIDLKAVSSIWGSCSPTNRLCFNRKLIMAPLEVIDYVVIHEVCHMRQRNHGSHFWALVAKFDPQYREHRRWLHRNHALLSI